MERELYVDDLTTGGGTVPETEQKKATTTEIFRQATFRLHKWHSNIPKLEISEDAENEDDLSYAKQQLEIKSRECGLLGLKWNKSTDDITVTIPEEVAQPTKRGILGKVGRLENMLSLSGGTYQLKIILQILTAEVDWYLKRTNYGKGDQSGLETLEKGQKALLPHPVRNPTKR